MKHDAAAGKITQITAAKPLTWMVRVGYVTRGTLFLIVGGLALLAAIGSGTRPPGVPDALQALLERPLGSLLLWLLAAGLLCFSGWRLLQAGLDADRHGDTPYGLMRRGSLAISGLIYFAVAIGTASLTFEERRTSEDQAARDWSQWLMAQPFGRILMALIGIGFIGLAIGLAIKVMRAPYRKHIDPGKVSRSWAVALGSVGILTRAFIFLMIGAFLCFAAYDANSNDVVALSGVLHMLQRQAYGGELLGIAALGLLAFGCFEMMQAAARRVRLPRA